MIYRIPHRIFFCPFYQKKKEFLSSKNAKHVKVNFVDDVLAIDLKKIEGMIEENMTKMRPSSMKNHDVCTVYVGFEKIGIISTFKVLLIGFKT